MLTIAEAMSLGRKATELKKTERQEVLDVLAEHECWRPFFKIIDGTAAKRKPQERVIDLTKKAQAYCIHLEDVNACASVVADMVREGELSFDQLETILASEILLPGDLASEGLILQEVYKFLPQTSEKVRCLERLCLIYEKKITNEVLLQELFKTLLKMDPNNVKALRFFKNHYAQLQEWEQVSKYLFELLRTAKHQREISRYGQELAAVFLYQLENPQYALKALDEYCQNSALDTSTIHFDAYYKLDDLDGCLKVLRSCLLTIDDSSTRAVVHYRIAAVLEQKQQWNEALENYQKAVEINKDLLEAYEGIIGIHLTQKNWPEVLLWLERLATLTVHPNLASQIQLAMKRLQEGLATRKS